MAFQNNILDLTSEWLSRGGHCKKKDLKYFIEELQKLVMSEDFQELSTNTDPKKLKFGLNKLSTSIKQRKIFSKDINVFGGILCEVLQLSGNQAFINAVSAVGNSSSTPPIKTKIESDTQVRMCR